MHLLNIYLKSRPTALQFSFASADSAMQAAHSTPSDEGLVTIVDDYGQTGMFVASDIAGSLVIDFAAAMKGEIDKQFIQARVQTILQEKYMQDAELANIMRLATLSTVRTTGNS